MGTSKKSAWFNLTGVWLQSCVKLRESLIGAKFGQNFANPTSLQSSWLGRNIYTLLQLKFSMNHVFTWEMLYFPRIWSSITEIRLLLKHEATGTEEKYEKRQNMTSFKKEGEFRFQIWSDIKWDNRYSKFEQSKEIDIKLTPKKLTEKNMKITTCQSLFLSLLLLTLNAENYPHCLTSMNILINKKDMIWY